MKDDFFKVLTVSSLSIALIVGGASPSMALDEIKLTWDGQNYASQTSESFIGLPVTVPGDHAERTLQVMNDGPTPGKMRVSIVNVQEKGANDKDIHHVTGEDNGDFYDDIKLSGTTESGTITKSFSEYANTDKTVIGEFNIDKGEVTNIAIRYDFSVDSTSGNKANVDERLATFDVLVEISGDNFVSDNATNIIDDSSNNSQDSNTGNNNKLALELLGFVMFFVSSLLLIFGVISFSRRRIKDYDKGCS